jgi:hypothetical protein
VSDDTTTPEADPIEAARAAGRAEALQAVAGEMVDSAFRAAAVGRAIDVGLLLNGIDRAKFLADDGTVDRGRIDAFLNHITTPVRRTTRP